jgi:hypothetical protein
MKILSRSYGRSRGWPEVRYSVENFEFSHIGTYLGVDIKVRTDELRRFPCIYCGEFPSEDHDSCIKNLPGVSNACCGHGGEGYIMFNDGRMIRGKFKIE